MHVHLDQASSTDVALVESDDVAPVDHQQPSEEESSEEEMVWYMYCHSCVYITYCLVINCRCLRPMFVQKILKGGLSTTA